uniref:LRRCT domain-containing protein n=1 Tax=Arion vulgaris TaxID=1028688 RepID=A0A0B6YAF1_9EUPU
MRDILVILISFLLTIVTCGPTTGEDSCPRQCRSCKSNIVECGKQSLAAPPKVYPQGTKTINLEGNHILVIAEKTFDYLDSVEVLKIGGNRVVALRNDAFSMFPNLATLDLVDNKISKVSKRAFKDLVKLRTLSLNRNKIESLDGFLQYVTNLFQLDVANNRITTIGPDDLKSLEHVHYLDFRDNLISRIDSQAFKNLHNLRYLFLNSNPLVTTPRFEFGSQVLELVDVSHCDLKTVPGPFPSSVTDLRLGNNRIIQVNHTDFLNITDLQLLTLNDNDLHFLQDGSLTHLVKLQELWLRGNKLVYIPRSIPDSVRKVHMDSNNIQQIEAGLFSNQSHLDYLTVENNQIRQIQPNTFSGLRFLNMLNFQENQLQTLEKNTFVDLVSLNTILLSNNPLKKIEAGAFKNMGNLTNLFLCYIGEENFELEGNFLTEMPKLQKLQLINSPGLADDLMAVINDSAVFQAPLQKMTQLDLSYNNLKWVSPRVRSVFPNLLSLPLDGNPLRCTKSLKWLKDWMVSSVVSFYNVNEIVCETPLRLKNRPIRGIADNEWADENEVETNDAVKDNLKETTTVLGNKDGGSEFIDALQQDAAVLKTKPVKQRDGRQSGTTKPKDVKEQPKSKGKGRKEKKPEKKSKGGKKGRDKTNKDKAKVQ